MSLSRLRPWAKRMVPLRPRLVRPMLEALEDRQLLSTMFGLSGVNAVGAYVGVGFQLNVLAGLTASVNGLRDYNNADFGALVNYGDGTGWLAAKVAVSNDGPSLPFLIKGSHVYQQAGDFTVQVIATQVNGSSPPSQPTATTSVIVSYLPSDVPATPPPLPSIYPLDPTDVMVNLSGVNALNATVGAAFPEGVIAGLSGAVSDQLDPHAADFLAWVNYGDSAKWEQADVVANNEGSSPSFFVEGSHTYSQAGVYPLVVYAVGPDGTSTSSQTTVVVASGTSDGGGGGGGGNGGGGGVSGDPVFLQKTDDSLWQYGATPGGQMLSPPGTILAISAVTDRAGDADVFAVTANHNLWEHTPAGWTFLSSGSFQQISAATNAAGDAVVFGVLTDNSLWEHGSQFAGGWAMLSPGGTILSVSAVTDAAGRDDVYAITSDSHLWEHTPGGWTYLSAGSFRQVSAGLNGAGQAVVYGVLTDASMWENNPAFGGAGWQELSGPGTILSVSAGGRDGVFAITSDSHLWEHTTAGWSFLSSGSFASLSGTANASGQSEVFATLADTSFWEYNPALTGGWLNLLTSGAASEAAPRS